MCLPMTRRAIIGGLVQVALITGALLAGSRVAHAEEEQPFSIGSKPAYFVNGGLTTGGSFVARDRGYFLGGELSLVRLHRGAFAGLYGDGYYDFGARRTYSTAGVELGYKFLGIDGGAAARIGGDHVEWGPTGRVFVTVGIFAIYARYAYFTESQRAADDHVVQIGALLKLPFAAWGGR
jgi:hypothetical protein